MARLVAQEGPEQGKVFEIGDGVTLGREKHNGIPMPTNRKASRDHAKLWREGPQRYAIADLGSTNGTLVNGATITKAVLADGDQVVVGEQTFAFELDESEKPRPKVAAAAGRQDLAALLRGDARPTPAAETAASIEVKQRILQYHRKGAGGSPLKVDVSQMAGSQRWLLLLAAAAVAVALFFAVRYVTSKMGGGGGAAPAEAPSEGPR